LSDDFERSLQDQICVIVGGSGAIGSAICRQFAEAGATCIVTYNRGKEAAEDLLLSLPGQDIGPPTCRLKTAAR
jgi:NAD(P)-dependent dehydrogenase (short-subunit alcohol dehydrogenase family)